MHARIAAFAAVLLAGAGAPLAIVPTRRATGAIRSDLPVRDAVVRTADFRDGPRASVGRDGKFALDGISSDVRRLYVTSTSHATRIVDLPSGTNDVDVGVVAIDVGRTLRCKLLGADDASVALVDDDGVALAAIDHVRGAFELSHVGTGGVRFAARVGGPGGALWLFETRKFEGEFTAPPFEIRFNTAPTGAFAESGRITWTGMDGTDTIPFRMFSYTLGVSSVRLRLHGPGKLVVEIPGAKPVVVEHVDVAADGSGAAEIVVAR